MNTELPDALELAEAFVRRIGEVGGVDIILFPPFPNLEGVHRTIDGSALQLGAQDVFWKSSGAFTGEVSAPMLRAVGCSWVIVGHSERRRILGDSDELVNRKLHSALNHDLFVILAIGESREERQAGATENVLRQQLEASLANVAGSAMDRIVLAYEPVWAIGTGETASAAQAAEAHNFVREILSDLYEEETASRTRIQYGGSVTPQNAGELLGTPGVDGALIGGASLKAEGFSRIVELAKS
jgi:triosephosphate isomerase (TIM)